jgi:hypothetical protein
MRTQHVVLFKGDGRAKVKTPGAGKNMVGEALQAPMMVRLCKLHYFQSRVHAWYPTKWRLR